LFKITGNLAEIFSNISFQSVVFALFLGRMEGFESNNNM